jgi:TrmH family RNA methyltransferase
MKSLENIRFILVGTTHPGNIGAAARAMKTMGLTKLHLVEPLHYPSAEATARASGADDVLANAVVHNDLLSALDGCHQVDGMSARLRHLPVPIVDPRQAVHHIQQQPDDSQIAIMFGREHSGLSNEELDRCHRLINIPANPNYSSLNLAAAVQVFAYELKMTFNPNIETGRIGEDREAIDAKDLEHLYQHFEQSLSEIGFLDPKNPKNLMRRLKRLFNRSDIDRNELQILHGILRAAENHHKEGKS